MSVSPEEKVEHAEAPAAALTLATFYDRRAPAALAYCARVCPPEAIAGAVEASFARALADGMPDDADELEQRLRAALRAEAAERCVPRDDEGDRRRFAREPVCARTPRLLIARASNDLSEADHESLASHLYTCADCRALDRRFDEAERTFDLLAGEDAPALGRSVVVELLERVEKEEGRRQKAEGTEQEAEVDTAPVSAEPVEPRRSGGLAEALERARAEAKPSPAAVPPPPPPPAGKPVSRLPSPASSPRGWRPAIHLGPRFRRRAALALLVVGILLLAEVALTALWKEPFTAYLASGAQSDLSKQLDKLERTRAPGEVPALARGLDARVHPGDALGRLQIPHIGIDFVVVQGTGGASLRKGPGHYLGTALPGEGQTVGIAGHRTTYEAPFRNVDQLRPGDRIYMHMPYGLFTYSVQYHRIVTPGAKVFGPAGYDRLVLSACHPLFSASHRIVVFARLVSAQPLNAARPAAAAPAAHGGARSASSATQRLVAGRLAALGSGTLSNGSRGSQVTLLQRLLGLPPTGYFGNDTTAAVKDFQRTHHLPITGDADAATKRALAHRLHAPSLPPTPASVAPATPQQQGSSSGSGSSPGTSSGNSGTTGGGSSTTQQGSGTGH